MSATGNHYIRLVIFQQLVTIKIHRYYLIRG